MGSQRIRYDLTIEQQQQPISQVQSTGSCSPPSVRTGKDAFSQRLWNYRYTHRTPRNQAALGISARDPRVLIVLVYSCYEAAERFRGPRESQEQTINFTVINTDKLITDCLETPFSAINQHTSDLDQDQCSAMLS